MKVIELFEKSQPLHGFTLLSVNYWRLFMNTVSHIKRITFTAVCLALCVVLPLALHMIPDAGSVISPMHIPVLLCGLICGWPYGLSCGLLAPVISSAITGMPPAAYMPPMIVELAVYGFVAGLLFQMIRTKNLLADMYISLLSAMLLGRIVAGAARALIFAAGNYSMTVWFTSYFVTALPGIVIHLVVVPVIFLALTQAHLIPKRYYKTK